MKTIVIPVFPGTNCERETKAWCSQNLDVHVEFLELKRHESLSKEDIAAVVLPGGFSYGDYLRAGAIAARSAELRSIEFLARANVPILGICNGFQILCEAGLLPGALVKNTSFQHHHFPVELRFSDNLSSIKSPWLHSTLFSALKSFVLPMSCGMGCYVPPQALTSAEQDAFDAAFVPLRYSHNENGSWHSTAAVLSSAGNVLGMMPHPERASDAILGDDVGLCFLGALALNTSIPIRAASPLFHFLKRHSQLGGEYAKQFC